MKEKKYKVCDGKKITGRKRVMTSGQIFSEIDFFGDINIALERGLCREVKDKEIEIENEEFQEENKKSRRSKFSVLNSEDNV